MTAPGSENWPPADGIALPTSYELDPFQKHAVLGIHAGAHVFVCAKTGSGKTFVGEYLCARALAAGGRVFYTTPIKSLSNQKYHDLKRLFPAATVGILTGDIKMCPDAQIVVMTAEILRNLFYKRGTATESVGLSAAVSLEGVVGIVMDEVHYIQDPDRGHVWEESLILCPRELQLVLLSATLPSAESLAGWLAALHGRQVMLLNTTYRVVPLVHGVLRRQPLPQGEGSGSAWTVAPYMDAAGHWNGDAYRGLLADRDGAAEAAAAHRRAVGARGAGEASVRRGAEARQEAPMARLRRTVAWLRGTDQLPALFFLFSRRECERYAAEVEGCFLDPADAAAAERIVDFHLTRHRATLERSPQYHAVRDLAVRGVAFHHSGLQPLLKEIVEILFARGLVRLLFATETFAVGLNMPTRTVVFLELRKFCDNGQQRLLRPDEYIQMAGRAGRRGKDVRGLVLYEPVRGEPVGPEELRGMVCGALPALESRMRFHYDFLLRRRLSSISGEMEKPTTVAEQSYWAAQQRAARAALGEEIAGARVAAEAATERVTVADRAEYREWQDLTTALEGAKNAARRRAQGALESWLAEHKGARWDAVRGRVRAAQEAEGRLEKLMGQATAWDAAPLLAVEPLESCLVRWGFLEAGTGTLTALGMAATEVNEGHPLLMPLLAESGRVGGFGAELACVLAAFIREGGGDDGPTLADADLSPAAMDTLYWLDERVRRMQADEDRAGIRDGPTNFWQLSALWVCVTARYVGGSGLSEIAAEFGLFEGNGQCGLLRVANLLEEWAAICELRADLAGLDRVRGLRLLRDDIVVDSLYLRL